MKKLLLFILPVFVFLPGCEKESGRGSSTPEITLSKTEIAPFESLTASVNISREEANRLYDEITWTVPCSMLGMITEFRNELMISGFKPGKNTVTVTGYKDGEVVLQLETSFTVKETHYDFFAPILAEQGGYSVGYSLTGVNDLGLPSAITINFRNQSDGYCESSLSTSYGTVPGAYLGAEENFLNQAKQLVHDIYNDLCYDYFGEPRYEIVDNEELLSEKLDMLKQAFGVNLHKNATRIWESDDTFVVLATDSTITDLPLLYGFDKNHKTRP